MGNSKGCGIDKPQQFVGKWNISLYDFYQLGEVYFWPVDFFKDLNQVHFMAGYLFSGNNNRSAEIIKPIESEIPICTEEELRDIIKLGYPIQAEEKSLDSKQSYNKDFCSCLHEARGALETEVLKIHDQEMVYEDLAYLSAQGRNLIVVDKKGNEHVFNNKKGYPILLEGWYIFWILEYSYGETIWMNIWRCITNNYRVHLWKRGHQWKSTLKSVLDP